MSWKSILSTVAPTIATAIGGPLAGMAVKTLAGSLLGDESAPEAKVAAAIQSATPDDLLKIKQLDAEFKTRMAELGVDLERIAADDRNSARDREKTLGGWSNSMLATVVVLGFFGAVGYAMSGNLNLDGEQGALIGTLIGYVSAKADQVVSYYFGSSSSSARKTELLKNPAR